MNIDHYESLSNLTGRMLVAANEGEWDQLIELEQQCSRRISDIRTTDDELAADEATRKRKIQLIRQILANDAQIRSRTEGWMHQLKRIMQSNKQEQRLNKTYGAL